MTSDDLAARGAPELLPCPFCGAEMGPHDGMRWVLCVECGAESGRQIDAQSAIAAWNRRATPATLVASPEVARMLERAILNAQLRCMERGRLDTPDEIRAAALRGEKEPK